MPAVPRCRLPAFRRRAFLGLAAALSASRVSAAGWPDGPVRIVTFAAPGGGSDAVARVLAEALARRWGQPVVVDNRPGASGIIAIEAFLNMKDERALLFTSTSSITVNPLLFDRLPYDAEHDLLPISFVVEDSIVVAAHRALAANSLGELVELARARPGALNYGVAPGGPYLVFLALQKAAGIELTYVPYRNLFTAVPDLTQGRIQLAVLPLSFVLGQVQAGMVKVLAVASPRRTPAAPDVPTGLEAGFPGFASNGGLGLFGAKDMPLARAERIAADVREIVTGDETARRLTAMGYAPQGSAPAEFAPWLKAQGRKFAEIAHAYGAIPPG